MKLTNIIIAFVAIVSLTSCNFDINLGQVNGNGNVTTETRIEGESFDEVKSYAGVDVLLTQGIETKVVVEADENLHEIISAYIENGKLHVGAESNIGKSKAKKIYVTYVGELKTLRASSGSDISAANIITSQDMEIDASSGADIDVEIFAKQVEANASSGADIRLSGKATNLDADASSGSDIEAKELQVINCIAEASSGAGITVNVKEKLDTKASSGGDIKYYGNPSSFNNNSSRSGNVDKM